MNEDLKQSIARALVQRIDEWHHGADGACQVNAGGAAEIAAQVATTRCIDPEEVTELRRQLARAERGLRGLNELTEAVRRTQMWDFAVYDEIPDDEWLAVDRERYEDIIHLTTQFDRWNPWRTVIERRLDAG